MASTPNHFHAADSRADEGKATNENLLDVKDRVAVLELDFQHNQDRVSKAIQDWFKDRRIVPVGNGMFLAVKVEKNK